MDEKDKRIARAESYARYAVARAAGLVYSAQSHADWTEALEDMRKATKDVEKVYHATEERNHGM